MTPREYFDSQPHGAIKHCCRKTGYSVQFVSYVINGRRKCSDFFGRVMETYTGGKVSFTEWLAAYQPKAGR